MASKKQTNKKTSKQAIKFSQDLRSGKLAFPSTRASQNSVLFFFMNMNWLVSFFIFTSNILPYHFCIIIREQFRELRKGDEEILNKKIMEKGENSPWLRPTVA